jgi:outer membrane protein
MAEATAAEASAADAAETSLGHEVKVGAKPMIDLLNAQRDTLAARVALAKAKADQVVTRYRLRAAIGSN